MHNMTPLVFNPKANSNQGNNGSRLLSVDENYGMNHDNNDDGSGYNMRENE